MTKPSHLRPAALNNFLYGTAYYPEHWDAETRKDDARRMAEAGWNCVRMAEFAWDRMEPREGSFDFSLFDATIETLAERGIVTILCTPTATPPRWLTLRHPEIVGVNEDGQPLQHGSRQHASLSNPTFREYSRRITRTMADHYRDNPHVVGWQTDNELHCHFSEDHSAAAQAAFAAFLGRKYQGDIGSLNAAWGTAFWAQTYDRFEDVPTPRRAKPDEPNPAHQLDYFRFLSNAVTQFQRDQVEILRSTQPRWFVTHNGCFGHIDYRGEFGRDLDFLSYDSYPYFQNQPAARAATHSFNLDRVRAWSGNFILMEQQSGPGARQWFFHDNPEPGEMRRLAYTSIARGADSLLFFRWRAARFGAEQYWCGILDHDNVGRRRYREAAHLGDELRRVGPALLGTSIRVDVAVAASDVDVVDSDKTYPLGLPGALKVAEVVHGWFFRRGYSIGCVHPSDDLTGVKLYVIPHWTVFDPAWLPNLESFVRGGGTLVLGARTASRDLNNNVVPTTLPGVLRRLAGVTVEEYGRQNAPEARPLSIEFGNGTAATSLWYETLHPDEGTETLGRWRGRHLSGEAAMTLRRLGLGQVIYVGSYLTEPLLEAVLPEFVSLSRLATATPSPTSGIEVVRREGGGKRLWFYINHADAPAEMRDIPSGTDLCTGQRVSNGLVLAANDVVVVEEEASD